MTDFSALLKSTEPVLVDFSATYCDKGLATLVVSHAGWLDGAAHAKYCRLFWKRWLAGTSIGALSRSMSTSSPVSLPNTTYGH